MKKIKTLLININYLINNKLQNKYLKHNDNYAKLISSGNSHLLSIDGKIIPQTISTIVEQSQEDNKYCTVTIVLRAIVD